MQEVKTCASTSLSNFIWKVAIIEEVFNEKTTTFILPGIQIGSRQSGAGANTVAEASKAMRAGEHSEAIELDFCM